MSTFPQSTLKYDKRNLYPLSAAPISEKISALPPSVMVDIRAGLEFEQKEKKCKFDSTLVEFLSSHLVPFQFQSHMLDRDEDRAILIWTICQSGSKTNTQGKWNI